MQAVADYFGVRMMVVTSYPEGELIEITPRGPLLTKRALYLSFWAEVRATLLSVGLSFRHCAFARSSLQAMSSYSHLQYVSQRAHQPGPLGRSDSIDAVTRASNVQLAWSAGTLQQPVPQGRAPRASAA